MTKRARSPRGRGETLRDEIVGAARELMADAPSADAVSIRAVAQAVGVTAPSIYRHFANKNDLITAVCMEVFSDLEEAMLAAAVRVDHPVERLRVYGHAYVAFAIDHLEHYRIALMDAEVRPDLDTLFAHGAFVHFQAAVQECVDADLFVDDDVLAITIDLWSSAHGVAALMIAKPYLPWGDRTVVVDRALRAACLGHMVTMDQVGLGNLPEDPPTLPDS